MSAALLVPAAIALAADGVTSYIPLVSLPGLFTAGTATNPVEIIKGIYGLAIGIGSVIATVMIIYAGFEYMYVESIMGKSAAKERIMNAFWGLLVILGSYILLRTINPSLVEFNITLPEGTKKLGALIAADKAALRREKAISDALKADAAAKAEIAALQANVSGINARIETLKKQQVGKAETSNEFRDAQVIIDALSAEKQRIDSQANEKTITSTKEILSTLLTDGQDSVMTNEINALNTSGSNYTTEQAFDLILGRKESTLTRLDKELAKMKALPETPNKAALVSSFEADINSYKDYIRVSKSIITGFRQILGRQTPGYDTQEKMAIIDPDLKQFAANAETTAKTYDSTNKPELANQIREDTKNSLLIAKTVFKNNCSAKTANLSICAQ
jgi:hypothetical protein